MKPFELSFSGVIIRFYLMMGIIIAAGFSGYLILGLLALPLFLISLMGVSTKEKKALATATEAKQAKITVIGPKREAV